MELPKGIRREIIFLAKRYPKRQILIQLLDNGNRMNYHIMNNQPGSAGYEAELHQYSGYTPLKR
jgi:hypothetical protein